MADVFVSYARGDQAHAGKIAQRLTAAGFTVWWDSELLPHNRFAAIIEEEIRAARAVLVLWSEAAIGSQWVRAEAELGREQDKLIQVSIDHSPVPLPFNQFQVADLRGWRGAVDHPQWRKVLASVSHFVARPDSDSRVSPPPKPSRGMGVRLWRWKRIWGLGAAGLALVVGALALVSTMARPAPRGQRIAIQPFRAIGGAAEAQTFSAELTDSLQNDLTQDQLQTVSSAETEGLKGDDLAHRLKALGAGLMFSGTVEASGPAATVSMRLDDPVQQATLWTTQLSGPAGLFDQLQARVGALTVAVLNCSAQGLAPTADLSDAALQAFLHACELSETSAHGLSGGRSLYAMLDAMRAAARVAPKFAAAHSMLGKHLAFMAPYMPADQAASFRGEAERETLRAQALDPKDPDAFVTLGLLAPPLEFSKREAYFRQALASDPAWPHANGFLGNVMTDVGRLQDAVALYQKAASVNPQSIDWELEVDAGLTQVGDTAQADGDLARMAQLWPNNFEILTLRLDSLIAQKRWAEALKLLDQFGDFTTMLPAGWLAEERQILSALLSGDPARRDQARRGLLARAGSDPEDAIRKLALLGFVDDAFAVARNDLRVDPHGASSTGFLFDVEAAALRRDPRFMALAARYGLIDYWRRTRKWPDFCQDPTLPYSCAATSAKL